MVAAKNNASNVSVGQGVSGGYSFSAPLGTPIPTDYDTPLDDAFVNMGFITEDGIEFGQDADQTDFYDLNGDVYETASGSQSEQVVFTLAEVKKDSLAEAYGQDNVTDDGGMITVKHNSIEHDERIYVFELLLKNGRKWRNVVPRGKAARSSSVTVSKGDIVGNQITVKTFPDENGNRMYDYIQSNDTQKLSAKSPVQVSK